MLKIPEHDSLRGLLSTLRDLNYARNTLRVVNMEAGGPVFKDHVLDHLDQVTERVTEAVLVELERRDIGASKNPWKHALNRQP